MKRVEEVGSPEMCRYRRYDLDKCGDFDWICTHPKNQHGWCNDEDTFPNNCPLEIEE